MSDPRWKTAPLWAKWLAMDGDGHWAWFSAEPYWDEEDKTWYLPDEDTENDGEYVGDGPDESGIDWDHAFSTLEQRP